MGEGKLYLIGLGLAKDLITIRGLKALRESDIVFLDRYTSDTGSSPQELEEEYGVRIFPVGRRELEEGLRDNLLKHVESGKKVALLVPGNPLIATTHISIVTEAASLGLDFEIIPAPGIIPNALSMAGLMPYKIGKPATVTYPVEGKVHTYVYDVVKGNDERNLHTILLLEMDAEKGVMMTPNEAVDLLLKMEELRGEGVLREGREAVVISALGREGQRICYVRLGSVKELPPAPGPHTIVITSPQLHYMEEEALKVIHNEYCRQ